jgi:hypothetical protein
MSYYEGYLATTKPPEPMAKDLGGGAPRPTQGCSVSKEEPGGIWIGIQYFWILEQWLSR